MTCGEKYRKALDTYGADADITEKLAIAMMNCHTCNGQDDYIPFTEDDTGYSKGDYDKFLTDDQRQYK